jgi:hypothetical protein
MKEGRDAARPTTNNRKERRMRQALTLPAAMGVAILLAVLVLGTAAQPGDAHPLGWNGIGLDNRTEIGTASNVPSDHKAYFAKAIERQNNWRNNNALSDDGVPKVLRPDPNRFGPTEGLHLIDNSGTGYYAYFDVNTSPDSYAGQTVNMARQPQGDRIGTYGHEIEHGEGAAHPGATFAEQAAFCRTKLVTSYIACGPEGDANTRIHAPGTGDTSDAIAADEAGGWSDFNEIGSFPQAGDVVHDAASAQECGPGTPNFDPNDPYAGQSGAPGSGEVPLDPSVSVVERYGEPADSEEQALSEAAAACVVFEPVDEEAAALLSPPSP